MKRILNLLLRFVEAIGKNHVIVKDHGDHIEIICFATDMMPRTQIIKKE